MPQYTLLKVDLSNSWSLFLKPSGVEDDFGYSVMTKFRGNLVVGSAFANASNPALKNIAMWNGTNWEPLRAGLAGEVFSVAGNERVLYALHAGETRLMFHVSRWDGEQWVEMGMSNALGEGYGDLFLGPNARRGLHGGMEQSGMNSALPRSAPARP